MYKDDEVLLKIDEMVKMVEGDNQSKTMVLENVYRKEAIDKMFCALNQTNQCIVLKTVFKIFSEQCESSCYLK